MSVLALLFAMVANGPSESVRMRVSHQFIAAVAKDRDPVATGVVQTLTPEQAAQLKTFKPCKPVVLSQPRAANLSSILWRCREDRKEVMWVTELLFDGSNVASIEIFPASSRPGIG
ncbi:hypothetical protein [Sphingomonas sp.]|uniref:hypothetical protein n=1 Tax=Sphingomonas sp. TaxID=28214 RepID=UPI00307E0D10